MRGFMVFAAIIVGACGSIDCSKADRHGTYLLHYEEQAGGGCGPVQDSLVSLDDSSAGAGCTVSSDQWSDGECKSERTIVCDDSADGLHVSEIAITTQKDSDGKEIDGTISATITNLSDGSFLCSSTYKITAKRQ